MKPTSILSVPVEQAASRNSEKFVRGIDRLKDSIIHDNESITILIGIMSNDAGMIDDMKSRFNRSASIDYSNQQIVQEFVKDDRKKLTCWMTIKDPIVRGNYHKFVSTQGSGTSVILVMVFYLIILLTEVGIGASVSEETTAVNNYSIHVLAIVTVVGVCLVSVLGIFIGLNKIYIPTTGFRLRLHNNICSFETAYVLSSTLLVGLLLFCRSVRQNCPSLAFQYWFTCNPGATINSLPPDALILYLILPLAYACVFRSVKFEAICLSWVIAIMMVVITILYTGFYYSFSSLLCYIPFSVLILYELQRQYILSFFLTERLIASAEDTEAQADEFTSEFRGLMGNMSHDLKTVSRA